MNKQKITSIVVVIIVYLLGIVSGSLVTKAGIRHFFNSRKRTERRLVNRLSSKLQLTDEQKNEVKSIIDKHRPEMKKLRSSIKEEMKKLKDNMHQDIKKVLNEEQSEKFDKIIKRYETPHKRKGKIRKGIRRQGMRLRQKEGNQ